MGDGGKRVEGLSKKEKGLTDMDNSVVIAGKWVGGSMANTFT